MGDACSPKNALSTLRAEGQAQGDIFSEAERTEKFTLTQRIHYENNISKKFGLNSLVDGGQKSKWDAISSLKNGKKPILDGQNYDRPSEIFKGKFWEDINKKLINWKAQEDTSLKSYQSNIVPQLKKLNAALNRVIESSQSEMQLNEGLNRFGLNSKTIYAAKNYIKDLENGFFLKEYDSEFFRFLNKGASINAKAQASLQLTWTLANGPEMIRVYSTYLTKRPSGFVDILQGTFKALEATNFQPWRRVPALEKKGLYGSNYFGQGGKNITPFELSITANKNLTYFLDVQSGGDGFTGVRNLLFDSSPWDRPVWDRARNTKVFLDLARYPINETRWLLKTFIGAKNGDKAAMANLLTYHLARYYFLGAASLLPSYAYPFLPEDVKEYSKKIDDEAPIKGNQLRKFSGFLLKQLGFNSEIDFSKYTQPTGVSFGSRPEIMLRSFGLASGSAVTSVYDLLKGNLPASVTRGLTSVSAMNNITAWGGSLGTLGLVNSTQLTDFLDTTSKMLEGEIKGERKIKQEYLEDFFGSSNVKKSK